MVSKKVLSLVLIVSLVLGILAGCSEKNDNNETSKTTSEVTETNESDTEENKISGEITVLTNRTDIVDTVFQDYAKKFQEKYPDVTVKFESMTDYEGEVKIRMNTDDYGDVLLIPTMDPSEYQNFFEPLGDKDEMSKKYRFLDKPSYEDIVYGIPQTGNASGILYNKKVFEEAGVTTLPTTPDEFITSLKKIKENTDSIPIYTNYAAGWTLNQWQNHALSVAGDPNYNSQIAHVDAPFAPGEPMNIVYKLMYDVVKEGLIEEDPFTSDWESSKQMMADGKIGTMVLGSWAITQVQKLAENKDDIGYMPFPYKQEDGEIYSTSMGDYNVAVNKNSKNKEAALAWLYWFIEESNYAYDEGGIPPVIEDPLPDVLKGFEELGVKYISPLPAPKGEEGLTDKIDQKAEVGLWQDMFKKRIIESALGNRDETFEDIMNSLNERWKSARKDLGVK